MKRWTSKHNALAVEMFCQFRLHFIFSCGSIWRRNIILLWVRNFWITVFWTREEPPRKVRTPANIEALQTKFERNSSDKGTNLAWSRFKECPKEMFARFFIKIRDYSAVKTCCSLRITGTRFFTSVGLCRSHVEED